MNELQKKVSVIVTAYNIEKYIEECVRSIMNQSLSDIEIICVDDCSGDGTLSVLKSLQKEDKRIVVRADNLNHGLAHARLGG